MLGLQKVVQGCVWEPLTLGCKKFREVCQVLKVRLFSFCMYVCIAIFLPLVICIDFFVICITFVKLFVCL